MKLAILSSRQLPLAFLILAAALAFSFFYTRHIQTTAAERAIRSGSVARLAAALDRRPALLDQRNRKTGLAPLHLAVMANRSEMVDLLLARGADVNAGDRRGQTPLHKAAAFNRLAFAEALMDRGADPLAFGIKYGLIRVAPIHLAAEAGFSEMCRLFLDRGVDVNLRTRGRNEVTALHMAAAKGQAAVVELLLKSGADVNARDTEGHTPLHWARVAEQDEVAAMLRIYDGIE